MFPKIRRIFLRIILAVVGLLLVVFFVGSFPCGAVALNSMERQNWKV